MTGFRSTGDVFLLTICLFAAAASNQALAQDPLRVVTEGNTVSIREGEKVLACYRYGSVPFKPYVQELFTPGGVNVLRDAPADHLHHHGLMFAVAVDGVNFWEEQQQPGRQMHRKFGDAKLGRRDNAPAAAFTEQIEWINPRSKELLLRETRTIEVCRPAEPAVTLLAWESKFEVPTGKESVTLSGSPYFGLGMRFLQSMDTGGQFCNAEGRMGVQETNDKQSAWCAYTAMADGKQVTVAMFGHPENERHPVTWFTMDNPFAYLSATPNLHKETLKVSAGKPLVLRYGVALWDGQVKPEQIEALYKRWTAWPASGISAAARATRDERRV